MPGLTDGLFRYHFVVVRVPQVHRPTSETSLQCHYALILPNTHPMDRYMNSLSSSSSNISSRNVLQNSQQQQHQQLSSSEEDLQMQRQLDEFNRSVTIIIWYKANLEPIRLQQILPTFPYFQLSQFANIISDLGLSPTSYLDTFIPGTHQWEQHTISSVRIVDTQQRLLYKIRRSLIEGLSEDECLSLRDEIQLQLQARSRRESSSGSAIRSPPSLSTPPNKTPIISPSPKLPSNSANSNDLQIKNSLKRAAPQEDQQDPRDSPKLHVSNGYYMTHSATSTMVSSPVTGPSPSNGSSSNNSQQQQQQQQSSSQGQDNSVYMYSSPVYYSNNASGSQGSPEVPTTLPHYLLAPQATAPIPYHPHPPLKRWPNDYTVSELSQGFHAMDLLISQSPTGASMTQRTAFERVFGSRYVKSTVCRHRAVWRKAPRILREQFEHMGADDRACWGEFVRRVENRPPGKHHHSNLDVDVDVDGIMEGVGVVQVGVGESGGMGYHSHSHSHSHEQHQQNESEQEDDRVRGQEGVMGPMNQVSSPNNNTMQSTLVYDSRGHLNNPGHNG